MSQRNIDFGTFPDDPSADAIRTAFEKVQQNFTELYSTVDAQAVLSVNRTPGPGITVNAPTGNVVVSAKLATVTLESTTLSVDGNRANSSGSRTIDSSSQHLIVELPKSISDIDTIELDETLTANIVNADVINTSSTLNGKIANFTGALSSDTLNVSGNATLGNVSGNGVSLIALNASNLSTGTVPSDRLSGFYSISVDNAANADFANSVGTVTSNAQPNITSVGTLSELGVNGDITATNIIANTGVFTGDGSSLSNLPGSNVSGAVANATFADDSENANVANSATTAGTVTTATQPNITSVGTLSLLNVTSSLVAGDISSSGTLNITGNADVGNISAEIGSFTNVSGNGSALTSLNADNLDTGTVPSSRLSGSYSISVDSATVANAALIANTVIDNAQPNITSVGNLTSLVIDGNLSANSASIDSDLEVGNLSVTEDANITANLAANNAIFSNDVEVQGLLSAQGDANVTGNLDVSGLIEVSGDADFSGNISTSGELLVTGSANITSDLIVQSDATIEGNISADIITANTGSFTNIEGALTTNSQPNITDVGTLTSLDVTGNLNSGNIDGGNLVSANFIQGDGSLLTNISVAAGSFIENGNSEVRVDANSNVRVTVNGVANAAVFTDNGIGVGGFVSASNVIATNNVSADNINANTVAGDLTTSSQPNVTSLGNLTSLTVEGVSNLGPDSNVIITGGVANAFLMTDGSGNLSWNTATLVPAQGDDTQVIFNDGGSTYAGDAGLTYNKTSDTLTVSNSIVSGNVYANSGTVRGNLLTGTLTTASQPNVTSIGTLSSLIVSGNINAGNVSGGNSVSASFLTGTLITSAQPNITSTGTLTGLSVNGNITAANITANTGIFTGNGSGLSALTGANVTGTVANATFATSADSATTAETVTTNTQPNITSVGTLSSLIVNGNVNTANISAIGKITANVFQGNASNLTNIPGANVTGIVANANTANFANVAFNIDGANVNGEVANASFATNSENSDNANVADTANSVDGANVSGAVSFASTANSVAGSNVSGEVANANFATTADSANIADSANSVDGANVSGEVSFAATANSVAGSNVTGTVANATFATSSGTTATVTTASQPNITSVGTLTSLSVSGNVSANNVTASSYHIRSVETGISATGTTQGTATGLTKEINVVSIVSGTAGVRLPTAVAGMVITITNTTANSLTVYPSSGGAINTLATDASFTQGPGATLQFIAPTTTQWYTVGATYA